MRRASDSASRQQAVQFACDLPRGPRRGPSIAVTHAGAVVRADARESGNFRLDEAPVRSRAAQTGVEDDSGCAFSGAPEMQSVPALVRGCSSGVLARDPFQWPCRLEFVWVGMKFSVRLALAGWAKCIGPTTPDFGETSR